MENKMKNGKNVVIFLTQMGVREVRPCQELSLNERRRLATSENLREEALMRIVGLCYNSIFTSSYLPQLDFEAIRNRVEREGLDFIEISSLRQDNVKEDTISLLLAAFPNKVIMPTGRWILCKNSKYYYFLFDREKDHYLANIGEIRKELTM